MLLLYVCNTEVVFLLLPYHVKATTCTLCHVVLLLFWPIVSSLLFYISTMHSFFCFAAVVGILCYIVLLLELFL